MKKKIFAIILISIILSASLAGISTATQIESNNETSDHSEMLRVDLRADCKIGPETEYVYIESALINIKKIDKNTNEVVDSKTLNFLESKLVFGTPTSIYKTSLEIEEKYEYSLIVKADGYKKEKEQLSAEELMEYSSDVGEYLRVITIEKKLFSNIYEQNLEDVNFGEKIEALFMLGTCVLTWWFVYLLKAAQRKSTATTEEFIDEHTVGEIFSYIFIGATFETTILYLHYIVVLLFPNYVEEFDAEMNEFLDQLFS